jgi:putative Holliday junction resolvase
VRSGVRLGVDVGKARVGVARTDPGAMIATPVETVPRASSGTSDIETIMRHAHDLDAVEIVVGLPLSLAGRDTASTGDARAFADALASAADVPVRLVDERLSTVSAQGALRASGRKGRTQRSVIDQVAAVIILQHALDLERSSGRPPGQLVGAPDATDGARTEPDTDEGR